MTTFAKPIRTISPATIIVNQLQPEHMQGDVIHLYDVYGVVKKTRTKIAARGNVTTFIGRFEATRCDGKVFRASAVVLLEPVQTEVFTSWVVERELKGQETQISFAARLSLKRPVDARLSVSKFEFDMQSLVAPYAHDPLLTLKTQIRDVELARKTLSLKK